MELTACHLCLVLRPWVKLSWAWLLSFLSPTRGFVLASAHWRRISPCQPLAYRLIDAGAANPSADKNCEIRRRRRLNLGAFWPQKTEAISSISRNNVISPIQPSLRPPYFISPNGSPLTSTSLLLPPTNTNPPPQIPLPHPNHRPLHNAPHLPSLLFLSILHPALHPRPNTHPPPGPPHNPPPNPPPNPRPPPLRRPNLHLPTRRRSLHHRPQRAPHPEPPPSSSAAEAEPLYRGPGYGARVEGGEG